MIKVIYVLLLAGASIEDAVCHKVRKHFILFIFFLGCVRWYKAQEYRWVSLALTCICFIGLYLLYMLLVHRAAHTGQKSGLGGADVRIIPGMMLVQGWDVALTGILLGLVAAVCRTAVTKRWKEEIPLVPWMSAGCIFVELLNATHIF